MGRYKARRSDRNAATFAVTAAEGKDGWRERVNAIVEANINVRVNGKTASNRTVEHNKSVIKCAFETWRDKLGFKISVPQNMQDRHVQALVQYWYDQGKAPTTMRGDLSVLRKFFGWMERRVSCAPLRRICPRRQRSGLKSAACAKRATSHRLPSPCMQRSFRLACKRLKCTGNK